MDIHFYMKHPSETPGVTCRTLKAPRKKHLVTYKGKLFRTTVDFSAKTLKAKVMGNDVFQILKGNGYQPTVMVTIELYFKTSGEIKPFKITVYQNNSTPLIQYCK